MKWGADMEPKSEKPQESCESVWPWRIRHGKIILKSGRRGWLLERERLSAAGGAEEGFCMDPGERGLS